MGKCQSSHPEIYYKTDECPLCIEIEHAQNLSKAVADLGKNLRVIESKLNESYRSVEEITDRKNKIIEGLEATIHELEGNARRVAA